MTTLLSINSNARRGAEADGRIQARLEALGPVVRVDAPGTRFLQATIDELGDELERLVIGGGDGTLHRVLPALLKAGRPVGVLPLGTANDFARALGVDESIDAALDAITAGNTRAVDVGFVNDEPFLNAVGIGLGPTLTRTLSREDKKRLGVVAYLSSLVSALGNLRRHRASVKIDGERRSLRFVQLTVTCAPYYGGGMTVGEEVELDDGVLHLLALAPLSPVDLLWKGLRLRLGMQVSDRTTTYSSIERLEVDTPRPMAVTADGELVTQTPITCTVHGQALRCYATVGDQS